jgi:hypothetical protein
VVRRRSIDIRFVFHIVFSFRFTERSANGLTLGGLLISIILRTIQFNVVRMRDKYLHTNCLAALANMSSQFQHLNPSVTQRIISLFNLLSRKHSKLLDLLQQQSIRGDDISRTTTANDDLTTVEDVMRTVLEIINSCLIHTLQDNVNLIYALLYNRDLFDNYRTHPNFQDVLQNIDLVNRTIRSTHSFLCFSGHRLFLGKNRSIRTTFG